MNHVADTLLADHIADTLVTLAKGGDLDLLRATVALLCQQRDEGHVCVSLQQWQGQQLEGRAAFPSADAWRAQLFATQLCNAGAEDAPPCPLVLRNNDRLYLLRHFRTEQRLLGFLRARLKAPDVATPAHVRSALQAVGLAAERASVPDWQLAAVATAASRSFAVLCGGPGTGKTTTIARLLAVLLHLRPQLRVVLAAPTGKAAARLGEALRERAAGDNRLGAIEAKTLHRLLRYQALDDQFLAGPDHPLPYDLIVVDEASMVDPAILAALCAALRPETQLLLVGDKDQLAAVAAGHVLGDLCRSARPELGVGEALGVFVQAATGMQLPVQAKAAPTANATISLVENHRFGNQPGLGAFAQAMAARDAAAAMQALLAGHDDLRHTTDRDAAQTFIEGPLLAAARATDPAAALQHLKRARILTASHRGPHGTVEWNRRIESMLRQHGVRVDPTWYDGRPVLVTANDYQSQVWNGDLGVVLHDAERRPFVWFPGPDGNPRAIAASRLPPHETAWAMTVHKAQGSEFDDVLVSMPDRAGPLWQASLVYTGVTRARSRAMVLADPALLAPCLGNWPTRSSGLVDSLAT